MTTPIQDDLPAYLSASGDTPSEETATYGIDSEQIGGPLLVIAGAGTGKTNTLAHRVAHLLAQVPIPTVCCS